MRQLPDHEPGVRTGQPVSNPPSNATTCKPPLPAQSTTHNPHAAGVGLFALLMVELGDGNRASMLAAGVQRGQGPAWKVQGARSQPAGPAVERAPIEHH